jgi:hypothetical protein
MVDMVDPMSSSQVYWHAPDELLYDLLVSSRCNVDVHVNVVIFYIVTLSFIRMVLQKP